KLHDLSSARAELRMGAFLFPLDGLKLAEFGPSGDKREDILYRATARTDGAEVAVDGALTDSYSKQPGVSMKLAFAHASGLLRRLPQPLAGWLGGDPRGT